MFEGVQPWIEMLTHIIEKTIFKLGNVMVDVDWWNVINSKGMSNVQDL